MGQEIEQINVPYTVHESDLARSDRKNKRLWLTINGIIVVLSGLLIYGVIRNAKDKGTNT